MTKNYKILTTYIKNINSNIPSTENYIYLKENIPKHSLGIDINSVPLKNNMAEVNIKLTFDDKSKKENKTYLEILHTTVVRVEEAAVNKEDLKRIFLSDVPTDVYPELESRFLEITKSIGYPSIGLEKKVNFKELFEKNQK